MRAQRARRNQARRIVNHYFFPNVTPVYTATW